MNSGVERWAIMGIAEFIASDDRSAYPSEAVENAKRAIVDTFACILSGAASELSEATLAFASHSNWTGNVQVLGTNERLAPALAALVHGTFAAALDFDDIIAPLHPSAPIVAALISAVDDDTSGDNFIDAYIVGIEVCSKIAAAMGTGHRAKGFHPTAILCGFGAIAAIGRLQRTETNVLAHAMGFMSTMAAGLLAGLGNMGKPLHSGLAAKNAFLALDMAKAGMQSNIESFEHQFGLFAAFGDTDSDPTRIVPSLGKPWTIMDPGPTLKKFPSCLGSSQVLIRGIRSTISLGDRASVWKVATRMSPASAAATA